MAGIFGNGHGFLGLPKRYSTIIVILLILLIIWGISTVYFAGWIIGFALIGIAASFVAFYLGRSR